MRAPSFVVTMTVLDHGLTLYTQARTTLAATDWSDLLLLSDLLGLRAAHRPGHRPI